MDTLALNRSEDQKVYFSTHTLAGDTTEALLRSAQLDWEYLSSPVKYDTAQGERVNDNSVVLYRSDNLDPVATVSNRFKPVQPKELVDFYLNLSRAGHYQLDALGCVGGGSNAIGMFYPFLADESVELYGVEAGGLGIETGQHAAPLCAGRPGVLHGNRTYLMEDENGQIQSTHSISAGLDYPGVGPEHSWLKDNKRVN